MRNLKKVLALVLALVMSFALLSTANATSFADDADIAHKEAVEVLTTAGIINGMGDNTFAPNGTLTRAQAAKIIAYVAEGSAKATKMVAGDASFEDVTAGYWGAAYIAYGVEAGILNGMGDNKFAPEATLTGYQFAKMLLVAMGVNGTYTGTNWVYNVATAAEAAGLFAEMDDVLMNNDLTREHACQMALNAMKYDVAGSTKYIVKDGETTVLTTADLEKAYTLKALLGANASVKPDTSASSSLLTKVHGITFSGKTAVDDFGTPGVIYTKGTGDKKVELKFADEVVMTLVGEVDSAKLHKALGLKDTETKDYTVYYNGKNLGTQQAAKNGTFKSDAIDTVKVYENTIVAYGNYFAKVTGVTEAKAAVGNTPAVKASITVELVANTNQKATFETEGFKVGDYVIVTGTEEGTYGQADFKMTVKSVVAASTISGKVDAVKGTQYRINGVYYTSVMGELAIGSEGTYYLNAAGKLAAVKAAETVTVAENVAYLYNARHIEAVSGTTTYDNDGVKTTTGDIDAYDVVYVVDANGVKATYTVAKNVSINDIKGPVKFKLNDKGEISEVTKLESIVEELTLDGKNAKLDGKYMLSSTKFVFVNAVKDTQGNVVGFSVATKTGYANVNIKDATVGYIADTKTNVVSVVFVAGTEYTAPVTSDVKYAVVTDAVATETKVEKDTVYTYGTTAGELTFKDAQTLAKNTVIGYTVTDGYATIVNDCVKAAKVEYTAETVNEYFFINDGFYAAGSVKLYTITDGVVSNGIDFSLELSKKYEATYTALVDAKGVVTDLYATFAPAKN